MSSEDKGRLARWAKRKAAARQTRGGAAPAIAAEPAAVPAAAAAPANAAKSGPEETGQPAPELDLPDVESLTAGSDFSAFMKDGVPAELRRLALRKLWASDPMFNVIDEMVEYGEDYTDAATVVAGMKSAWEAGRGYAKKTLEENTDDRIAAEDAPSAEAAADGQVASEDEHTEDGNDERG